MDSIEVIKPQRINIRAIFQNNIIMVAVILVLFVIVAMVFSPYFATETNIRALMRDISFAGMIAVAQSMLLILGELDLSVGASACLAGIFSGLLMTSAVGVPGPVAFAIGLIAGFGMGALNGFIITSLRINALVTTIGMQGVYAGVTLVLTKGYAITSIPESVLWIGQGSISVFPISFVLSIGVLILAVFFVKKTRTGRYVYAIGNSKPAAEILGIRVDRVRILVFSIAGLISAPAWVVYVARLASAQTTIGTTWALNSLASSVIGGVALTGGIGNPIGAFLGASIISIISNIIVLFGVSIYWQQAVSGIIIVVAIALPSIIKIVQEKSRIKGLAISDQK